MQIFNLDTSNIYFPEIKNYFEEVLSSYTNGKYRSAIVLLYSVAVCDIMKKLNELKDLYNDEKATEILENIEKKRLCTDPKKIKPTEWENDLINELKNKNLFTQQEITNLYHLKEDRNLSAHPTLNHDYNLIQPTQEKTISYIRDMYDIFIKPPIFISNIIDRMSNELSEKKELYIYDFDKLKRYVTNAYISRISDSMLQKIFKTYWKFVFSSPNDEHCIEDIEMNRKVLDILYEYNPSLLENYIKINITHFNQIANKERIIQCLIFFLSRHPEIYKYVDSTAKDLIDNYINKNRNFSYKFISWFKSENRDTYIKELEIPINANSNIYINKEFINYAEKQKKYFSNKDTLKEFYIRFYGNVDHFEESQDRYNSVILPFLNDFNESDFIKIIESINKNNQHYKNRHQETNNTNIVYYLNKLNPNFNYDKYKYFKYDCFLLENYEKNI